MSEQTLPKMLKYSTIKPKGVPSKMRRVEINQLNNNQQINFNDIIRFQFQTEQFIDPYSAYIEIQVEIPQSAENMPSQTLINIPYLQTGQILNSDSNITTNPALEYTTVKSQDFNNVPLYILDGPATSLITEMIFYSNSREIERIDEYDQLGNLIADMGIDQLTRSKSGYYGLASSFGKSDYSYLTHQIQNQNNSNQQQQQSYYSQSSMTDTWKDIMVNNNNAGTSIRASTGEVLSLSNAAYSIYDYDPITQSTIGMTNTYNSSTPFAYNSPINDYLDIGIIAVQETPTQSSFYVDPNSIFTDHNSSSLTQATNHLKEVLNKYNNKPGMFPITTQLSYQDTLNGKVDINSLSSAGQIFQPKQYINYAREFALQDGQYGIEALDTISITPYLNIRQSNPQQIPQGSSSEITNNQYFNNLAQSNISTDTINYQANQSIKRRKRVLYNNASNQNNFTYLAPGIAQQRWHNGKPIIDYNIGGTNFDNTIKEQKYGTTRKTFYVPLLSGVIGHLIPKDSWKLIPGRGCGQMSWEFRLNRYAFYMSGHKKNDGTTGPVSANEQFHMGNTARNGWNVAKVSLHFDVWDFDESVHETVNEQLKTGIIMNSQSFINGPTYSVATTQQLRGSWQINNSAQSVKNIFFWFLLDDYMKYNFCRKQFRISQNIKSVQFKLGQEFIPEQPIVGHAGNLIQFNDENTRDCMPFYTELLRTQGEMFSNSGMIQILPQNFIMNERAYDINNQSQSQFQTAFLHETRLCGKAIFTVNLEPDQFDHTYLSGKDISKTRPVELVLDVHPFGDQTRPSTMFILIHADSIVSFTLDGIQIAV